jgi:hypothetical protein
MGPTKDEAVNARLNAIGRCEIQKRSLMDRLFRLPTIVEWSAPIGLENDLAPFTLRFFTDARPREASAGYEALLADWDAFRRRFSEYVPQFRAYLLELFRGCYLDEIAPREKAQYLDKDLKVSDSAILKHVESGIIGLSWDGKSVTLQVWFAVDWDPEHGADVEFDPAGNVIKPWQQSAVEEEAD